MRFLGAAALLLTNFTSHGFLHPAPNAVAKSRDVALAGLRKVSSRRTALNEQRMAEKVLANPKWPSEWPYTASDLARMDEEVDTVFYSSPRLVTHIDDPAIMALTNYYASEFKDGDDVLDICSSWISHYPKEWKGGNVVGLGMNEYELSQNKVLNSYDVQDLNEDPTFPYDDASFDTVTCVVSVDYLNKPKEIFKEIGRVLKPGGKALIAISNRCFPTKAWNLWLRTNDLEHVFIVGSFFHFTTGVFEEPSCADISPNPGRSDPMYVIKGLKKVTVDNSSEKEALVEEPKSESSQEEKGTDVAKDSSEADEKPNEKSKKRKDVMAFLKSKGAIGMKQDFSNAKGVDEGSEDRSLEDLKTIQTIRGLKKKAD